MQTLRLDIVLLDIKVMLQDDWQLGIAILAQIASSILRGWQRCNAQEWREWHLVAGAFVLSKILIVEHDLIFPLIIISGVGTDSEQRVTRAEVAGQRGVLHPSKTEYPRF